MASLSVEDLWLSYGGSDWVLRGVSFSLGPGVHVVAGGTGSGKSSLLRALAGVAERIHGAVVRGRVRADGRVLLVPQEPDLFILMPTVSEELEYLAGLSGGRYTAGELASIVGLEDRLHMRISRLSAGERQRLALASVWALGSDIVLLDEPLAYLDLWGARELVSLLHQLARKRVVVIAEHRLWMLAPLSPRVLVLEGGRLVFEGGFEEACERGFERLDFGPSCG